MAGLRKHQAQHADSQESDDTRAARDEEQFFFCSFCPSKFSTVQALQRHHTRKHNAQQLSCTFCVKKFAENCYLQEHIKICPKNPAGAEKEECPWCQKLFFPGKYMRRHMRSAHGFNVQSKKSK